MLLFFFTPPSYLPPPPLQVPPSLSTKGIAPLATPEFPRLAPVFLGVCLIMFCRPLIMFPLVEGWILLLLFWLRLRNGHRKGPMFPEFPPVFFFFFFIGLSGSLLVVAHLGNSFPGIRKPFTPIPPVLGFFGFC